MVPTPAHSASEAGPNCFGGDRSSRCSEPSHPGLGGSLSAFIAEATRIYPTVDRLIFEAISVAHFSTLYSVFPLVWLLIIGASSGGKTLPLGALKRSLNAYWVSELTENSLISTFSKSGEDNSLAPKLINKTMVLKDLTTLLSKRAEAQATVFAHLREIYDGQLRKTGGNGFESTFEGRMGVVAASTGEIDQRSTMINSLGPRFLSIRVPELDRRAQAQAAMRSGNGDSKQHALQEAFQRFEDDVTGRGLSGGDWSPDVEDFVWKCAELLTRGRTPVRRDGRAGREMVAAPELEAPGRAATQLLSVARVRACLDGRDALTSEDLALARRLAIDSITPKVRLDALKLCASEPRSISRLAKDLCVGRSTAERTLHDLRALELVREVDKSWTCSPIAMDVIASTEFQGD